MQTSLVIGLFSLAFSCITALPIDKVSELNDFSDVSDKISQWTCLEHYHLWNGFLTPEAAMNQSNLLLQQAEYTIGYQELAKSLGYKPRPWSSYTFRVFSEEAIKLEPTMKGYFEANMASTAHLLYPAIRPSEVVLEAAIVMLDKRDPVIRSTFKRIFEEARRSKPSTLNKNEIDRMLNLFEEKGLELIKQYQKKLLLNCENDVYHSTLDNSTYVALPTIPPTTSPTPADAFSGPVDEDAVLDSMPCLTKQENNRLLGGLFYSQFTRLFAFVLVPHTIEAIGLEELRSALGFPLTRPFTEYNETRPSELELESAPTVQAYYELKEPRVADISLDKKTFSQPMFQHTIQFIDERLPGIPKIYRRRLEKVRKPVRGEINRKTVDLMLKEYSDIAEKVHRKTFIIYNSLCQNIITTAISTFLGFLNLSD